MNLLLKILISISFLTAIFLNLPKFTSKFDYQKTKYNFDNSPYVLNDKYKIIIEDEDNDAWQGINYLARSGMEETIYDHPPFGKFLIGFSIFLTGNQNMIQIFISFFALVAFYFLSKEVLKNTTLALFSSLMLSFEPLFREQVSTSLLDQDLLLLLTLTLLFILKSLKNSKYTVASLVSLGLFSSIKFPANSVVLITTIFIFYLITKRPDLIKAFIKYFIIVPIVYLIFYMPFIDKPSLSKFIDLQIFGIKWHKTHLPDYPKFEIFRLLIFNSWRTWWGAEPFIKVPYFHIGWPISALSLIFVFFQKLSNEIKLIIIWCILYLALSSLRVVFPRYLLLVLPFLYLVVIYLVSYAYRNRRK